MKQKRAKQYRKQMHVYQQTFKFKTPIQTIVDSELVLHCEKTKFDIFKGVQRTIQMEPKLMITQCCINHLYESKNQEAIELSKTLMEKRRCNHRETLSSFECIKSIADIKGENKHRYLVATQDEKLRQHLRKIAGVPLIYMNRSVMIMEPMSRATEKVVQLLEAKKLTSGLNDIHHGTKSEEVDEEEEQVKTKKRKGPKGPNPLSIKKKKVEKVENGDEGESKKETQSEEGAKKKTRKRSHKKSTSGEEEGDKKVEAEANVEGESEVVTNDNETN